MRHHRADYLTPLLPWADFVMGLGIAVDKPLWKLYRQIIYGFNKAEVNTNRLPQAGRGRASLNIEPYRGVSLTFTVRTSDE